MIRAMNCLVLGALFLGCGSDNDNTGLERTSAAQRDVLACPEVGMCDAGADDQCDAPADFCRHGYCGGDHDKDPRADCDFDPPSQDDDRRCCSCGDCDGRRADESFDCRVKCKDDGCETKCEIDRCESRCKNGHCTIDCRGDDRRGCNHGECLDLCGALSCEDHRGHDDDCDD